MISISNDLHKLLGENSTPGEVVSRKRPETKKSIKKSFVLRRGGTTGKVYVLKLENSKFYIGFSNSVQHRIKKHFAGKGARWTKRHKPVEVVEIITGTEQDERAKTLEYAAKYGWRNVRGFCWCAVKFKHLALSDEIPESLALALKL